MKANLGYPTLKFTVLLNRFQATPFANAGTVGPVKGPLYVEKAHDLVLTFDVFICLQANIILWNYLLHNS